MSGFYNQDVVGWTQEDEAGVEPTVVRAHVGDAHRDPGYWGTSRRATFFSGRGGGGGGRAEGVPRLRAPSRAQRD